MPFNTEGLKQVYVLLLVSNQLIPGYTNLIFGHFEQTEIIINTCDNSWSLGTEPLPTLKSCALWCSRVADCRRLLYCEETKLCTLYEDERNCVLRQVASDCTCFRRVIGCQDGSCICPLGYYGERCENIVIDCKDAVEKGMTATKDMTATIQPLSSPEPFELRCWLASNGAMAIFDRNMNCFVENFNRSIAEYEAGFGDVHYNRWLGFDKILHIMGNPHTSFLLWVSVFNSTTSHCVNLYRDFTLTKGSGDYLMDLTYYPNSGPHPDCGDGLAGLDNTLDLRGRPFSTYDRDRTTYNCPGRFRGGWWYADDVNCSSSLLTGTPIFWKDLPNGEIIKKASMKLLKV